MKYILLIIILFLSIQANSQIKTKDGYFDFQGKAYKTDDLGHILKTNDRAYSEYKAYQKSRKGGWWAIAGVAMTAYGILDIDQAQATDTDASSLVIPIIISGLSAVAIGLSQLSFGKDEAHLDRAIDIYNYPELTYHKHDKERYFNLSLLLSNDGAGLCLTF